jgi:carbonic anhydrase/acetyltransferase-like protein (isoleucine patch superfamily)
VKRPGRVLPRVLSIHKYPRYLADLYIRVVMQKMWRCQGVNLEDDIIWLGKPVLSLAKGSSMRIGANCVFCSRSSQTALGVNHPMVLRTLLPHAQLHIGAGARMSGTTICAAEQVIIGNRCVIGSNVTIADTDFHSLDPDTRSSDDDAGFAVHKPVEIGDDVFIGGGSIILKGVRIGAGAVIGAGSVVTGAVPEMTIVAGNPARPIGSVQRSG